MYDADGEYFSYLQMTVSGALSFAELSSVVPRSGAEYSYFLEAYRGLHKFWGPLPCFICAFVQVCILNPTASAIMVLTFSEYICQPFVDYMNGLTPEYQDVVKKIIAILALSEWKNYVFLKQIKYFNR
jgi:L-type amino acid transporter 9